MGIAYHVIVLIVAVFALARGWKLGFAGQMGGVIGFSFGLVMAHIFLEPASEFFFRLHLWPTDSVAAEFASQLLGCSTVYAATYAVMWILGHIIARAMSLFTHGVLDSLFGSAMCLAKYILVLSIFFNFAVAANPSSMLMKYATDDDGNLAEGVMLLAPSLLGCLSFEDLAHRIQLREARKISCLDEHNHRRAPYVNTNGGHAVSGERLPSGMPPFIIESSKC